jgi:hypothetical protein
LVERIDVGEAGFVHALNEPAKEIQHRQNGCEKCVGLGPGEVVYCRDCRLRVAAAGTRQVYS